jgi:tetratricopeptide (TPR) repeat protein
VLDKELELSAHAYERTGQSLMSLGRHEQAITALTEAIALDPNGSASAFASKERCRRCPSMGVSTGRGVATDDVGGGMALQRQEPRVPQADVPELQLQELHGDLWDD